MMKIIYLFLIGLFSVLSIEDPFNIFCGQRDCYDIIEINRKDFNYSALKKSYRRLSLILHPDKNKDKDTTEAFRELSKAMEVLGDETQKELYDYYLDHPREYYRVTGKFYYRKLPQTDVRLIIFILLVLFSILSPAIQYQKWQTAVNYLKYASINNLGLKAGGTKQTQEIYRRALEKYEEYLNTPTDSDKKTKSVQVKASPKLAKEPEFIKIIDEIVSEVQIEGGYKKPTWKDIFIIRLAFFPYDIFIWSKKFYRRKFQRDQMSFEELLEFAEESVGSGTWHSLTEEDQDILVEREVWNNPIDILEKYSQEKFTQELSKNPNQLKRYQRYKKKQK